MNLISVDTFCPPFRGGPACRQARQVVQPESIREEQMLNELNLRRYILSSFPRRTGLPKARQVVQLESIRKEQMLNELNLGPWSLCW